MHMLSDELWSLILEFVPPLDVLRSASDVCRTFCRLSSQRAFWQQHPLLPVRLRESSLTKHQLQRCCVWISCQDDDDEHLLECLQASSMLVSGREALFRAGDGRVCAASTTDNPGEFLENVLPSEESHSDQALSRFFYDIPYRGWSSRASRDDSSSETLLFVTNCPTAFLSRFQIAPMIDPYHSLWSYPWKKSIIQAFHLPNSSSSDGPSFAKGFPCSFDVPSKLTANNEDRSTRQSIPSLNQDIIDNLLRGHAPVYESEPNHVLSNCRDLLVYDFPHGVVANVVVITLVGKQNEQFTASGEFYACVKSVDCWGIPLPESAALAQTQKDWHELNVVRDPSIFSRLQLW